MNKRVFIPVIVIMVLVIGIVGVLLLRERPASVITLDINPSIEINLDKDNKIMNVKALNDDAKVIVDEDYKGMSLGSMIYVLVDKVRDNHIWTGDKLSILMNVKGNEETESIRNLIQNEFAKKDVEVEVIVIDKITKEDETLAKKYNITPSKAAYLKTVNEKIENINIEDIVDKSINELEETKQTGRYCDAGYTLNGDWCRKEIKRVSAKQGDVCPVEYMEYKGKCYPEERNILTGKKLCNGDLTLVGDICYKKESMNAEAVYTCSSGELARKGDYFKYGASDNDKYICVDPNSGEAPTLRCLKQPHKMINGKCYVGPAPTINGGCPNGDKLVGGGCYSKDPGDQWECPDGAIYHKSQNSVPEKCPDTIKYTWATISEYKCPEGHTLEGNKCTIERTEDPIDEWVCPTGYTKVESGRCLNLSKAASKENGYYCEEENSVLEDKICIVYELKEVQE